MKENLGTQLYLSLIANSEFAIGNSSSGLYEVPLLQKPTSKSNAELRIRLESGIQDYTLKNHPFSKIIFINSPRE